VTGADLIIGTSAGASVAAMLGSGLPLADLFARQADPSLQSAELAAELDVAAMTVEVAAFMKGATTPADAVTASSAVPGFWPPVTIGGSRYSDGGVRSADNADLASGSRATLGALLADEAGKPF
jgi:predicted acylesterase/phospholipase RssA